MQWTVVAIAPGEGIGEGVSPSPAAATTGSRTSRAP